MASQVQASDLARWKRDRFVDARACFAHTILQSKSMKDRLTVTIDAELAGQAKRVAHLRKTSVSGVVEASLRSALGTTVRPGLPFSERWAGKFTLRSDNPGDLRHSALKAKYHLQ